MLETKNDKDFASNNEILINEIVAQMEKELQMCGEQHTFQTASPIALIQELASFFIELKSTQRLSNIVYRIDINLKAKGVGLHETERVAELAWDRVFQKVWFRKKYRETQNTSGPKLD